MDSLPAAVYDYTKKCYKPAKGDTMEEVTKPLEAEYLHIQGMTPAFVNKEKVQYELIPAYPLAELAWVYTAGAMKHTAEGWRQGMSVKSCVGKLFRHLMQWLMGSTRHEKGMHHMGSVAFYAFALMEQDRLGMGDDDREDS